MSFDRFHRTSNTVVTARSSPSPALSQGRIRPVAQNTTQKVGQLLEIDFKREPEYLEHTDIQSSFLKSSSVPSTAMDIHKGSDLFHYNKIKESHFSGVDMFLVNMALSKVFTQDKTIQDRAAQVVSDLGVNAIVRAVRKNNSVVKSALADAIQAKLEDLRRIPHESPEARSLIRRAIMRKLAPSSTQSFSADETDRITSLPDFEKILRESLVDTVDYLAQEIQKTPALLLHFDASQAAWMACEVLGTIRRLQRQKTNQEGHTQVLLPTQESDLLSALRYASQCYAGEICDKIYDMKKFTTDSKKVITKNFCADV